MSFEPEKALPAQRLAPHTLGGPLLPPHEWALYRAVRVQGLPIEEASELYLGGHGRRDAKRTLARIHETLVAAARRQGREDLAHVLEKPLAPEDLVDELEEGQKALRPRFRAFDQEHNRDDSLPREEAVRAWIAAYPGVTHRNPDHDEYAASWPPAQGLSRDDLDWHYGEDYPERGAARRAGLRQEKFWALIEIQRRPAPVGPTSLLTTCLHPSDARRLGLAGVNTVGELSAFRERHGTRWVSKVPKLGAKSARRIEAMLDLEPVAHAPRPALPVAIEASGLAPLDRMVIPAYMTLPGRFRGDAEASQLGAVDDIRAVQIWIDTQAESAATKAAYTREADRLMNWCARVAKRPLSDLTIEDCKNYLAFLMKPPESWIATGRHGRSSPAWRPFRGPLSGRSIFQALAVLRALYSFLVKSGHLVSNPWSLTKVKREASATPKVRHLDFEAWGHFEDWLARLPQDASTLRLRAIIEILYGTGIRRAEIETLRAFKWTPRDRIAGAPGGWSATVTGKGPKDREIVIGKRAIKALGRYLVDRDLPRDPRRIPRGVPVFANLERAQDKRSWIHADSPARASTVYRSVKWAMLECADDALAVNWQLSDTLRRVSPHWLRHCYGWHRLQAGDPLELIQAQLGHKSIAVTASIYTGTGLAQRIASAAAAERRLAQLREGYSKSSSTRPADPLAA